MLRNMLAMTALHLSIGTETLGWRGQNRDGMDWKLPLCLHCGIAGRNTHSRKKRTTTTTQKQNKTVTGHHHPVRNAVVCTGCRHANCTSLPDAYLIPCASHSQGGLRVVTKWSNSRRSKYCVNWAKVTVIGIERKKYIYLYSYMSFLRVY